jgi:hypothetical protein
MIAKHPELFSDWAVHKQQIIEHAYHCEDCCSNFAAGSVAFPFPPGVSARTFTRRLLFCRDAAGLRSPADGVSPFFSTVCF